VSSTTPSSPDVSTKISVDRNDRQVVVAVEDPTPGGTSIVAAVDPLVDRQVLEQLVDELLVELDRVHVDGPELVAKSLREGSP
jgi:hypothetical protein